MRVNEHIDFRSDSELTSIMFFLMAAICKATKGKALKNTEISKDEPLNAKKELKENIFDEIIGGTRLHTLMVDACLPLWSVHHQRDIFETWFHWTAGDVPKKFQSWSREKGLTSRSYPFCNGLAQAIIEGSLRRGHFETKS